MTAGFAIFAVLAIVVAVIWAASHGLLQVITVVIWVALSITALSSCVSAFF